MTKNLLWSGGYDFCQTVERSWWL